LSGSLPAPAIPCLLLYWAAVCAVVPQGGLPDTTVRNADREPAASLSLCAEQGTELALWDLDDDGPDDATLLQSADGPLPLPALTAGSPATSLHMGPAAADTARTSGNRVHPSRGPPVLS
jgi:hypothetical protein